MRELPELFKARMKEQLKDEYEEFLACYEREGYAGLRVNTEKISVERFRGLFPFPLEPVPWTDCGFYYEKVREQDEEEAKKVAGVTKHPYYYAGLYYIQEPSAMLPASVLPVNPGDRVLDLCAAPGGKSTHLAAKLGGKGLLVANDASASRAKALLKNLTVWGCTNSVITGETPEKLLEAFEENNISFEHMPSGIDTMCVVVHEDAIIGKKEKLMQRIHELCEPDAVEIHSGLALIATVGRGMVRSKGISARLFNALMKAGINVRLIDQGSSELNIIVGVDNLDFENAVRAIYRAFVVKENNRW